MPEHLQTIGIGREYEKVMKPCEVCSGEDFALLQSYGRIGEPGVYGEAPVRICRACGYKMTNPRYEDQFYKDYYERLYREVAFGAEKPSEEYIAQQRARGAGVLEWIQAFVSEPRRMLDHGCASGATMLAWKDAGWVCQGIDPHRPSVETGVKELGLDIEIAAGEELPQADDSLDLILSLGSLEHSYDIDATLCECRRVLVAGGALVIRWRSDEIFGSPLEYYNHNHYRFLSDVTWGLLLRRYGFSVEATTRDKLEGWDSYAYTLARADLDPSEAALATSIREGEVDDWDAEVEKLAALREDYYERCSQYLAVAEANADDPEAIVAAVRRGDVRWGLLGGTAEWVTERATMEARRYLAEYEAGRVV